MADISEPNDYNISKAQLLILSSLKYQENRQATWNVL
jgi:hypothetical protein